MIPARTETVVIFLPDVSSCLPNRLEYDQLRQDYKLACEKFVNPDPDGEIQEFKKKIYSFPNEFVDRVSKIPTITIPDEAETGSGGQEQKDGATVGDSSDNLSSQVVDNPNNLPDSDVEMIAADETGKKNNNKISCSQDNAAADDAGGAAGAPPSDAEKQNTGDADAVAIVNSNSGYDKALPYKF